MTYQQIEQALTQEARHPGTIDKVLTIQTIRHLLLTDPARPPARLLAWYTGTLARWRRSLASYRPLADIPPAERPRIRALLAK